MRWLKITLAYDGAAYAGWQVQPDLPTVQAIFESAWQAITSEDIRVTASGRTDAGVHALGQVVGVATESRLGRSELLQGLNAMLPDDVVVHKVENAPENFHATYDAVSKHYRYQIHNSRVPTVFDRYTTWHVPQSLDVAMMHTAAQLLVGEHDFASFESAGSERDDTVRKVFRLDVTAGQEGRAERIAIDIVGNGFLYNMVRSIAGTLVSVGRGRREPAWVAEVLAAKDRARAGQTAPAHGLFLVSVEYDH